MGSFLSFSRWGALRALSHPNYRLFFFGQGVSLIGTWMQQTALIWLVYRLTGSAQILGTVDFIGQISGIVLIPLAGALLDRYSRYRAVITTQSLAMVQALTLAALVLSGEAAVWQVALLHVFYGMINSFEMPARQSFVVEIVADKRDLPNAIALNSALFNSARVIGPAVAGWAIAAVGEGICFLLNGISYGAVLISLLSMRLPARLPPSKAGGADIWKGIKEGLAYAKDFRPIRWSLLLLVVSAVTVMPLIVLLPVFVGHVLGGGPRELGILMTSFGAGALAGTFYLASRKNVLGLEKVIPLAGAVCGAAVIAFTFSRDFRLSLGLTLIIGFGMICQVASINTVIQTLVDEDKRGRVISLYTLSFGGFAPLGSLLIGALAGAAGAPLAFRIAGLVYLMAVAAFFCCIPSWRAAAAPVYAKKGIGLSQPKEKN